MGTTGTPNPVVTDRYQYVYVFELQNCAVANPKTQNDFIPSISGLSLRQKSTALKANAQR
jgi:hypothetical protein